MKICERGLDRKKKAVPINKTINKTPSPVNKSLERASFYSLKYSC